MECIVQCQDLDDIDDDDDVSSRNHFGALRLSRLATECYVEGQNRTRNNGALFISVVTCSKQTVRTCAA